MNNVEKRYAHELRAEPENRTLRGYASVFNSYSLDLGGFRELIDPHAFDEALPTADVRALVNHDPSLIIGRSKAGTLRLQPDSHGLGVEIDLPETTLGRDIAESVRRGDLDGMSFGMIIEDETWERTATGPVRTVKKADIFDVSVVAFPAFPASEVSLRAIEKAKSLVSRPIATELRYRTIFAALKRI